jgi:hypothetical protein
MHVGEYARQELLQFLQRPKTQRPSSGDVLNMALEPPLPKVRPRAKLQDKGLGMLPVIHHESSLEMADGEVIMGR